MKIISVLANVPLHQKCIRWMNFNNLSASFFKTADSTELDLSKTHGPGAAFIIICWLNVSE
jgi:hypothetical protein